MVTNHVTIRTVARMAGVSPSTVSAAFNQGTRISPATRERILRLADELGWQPDRRASTLRRTDSRVIGMVYEVGRPYQTSLVDAVYEAAAQHGLEVVLAGATAHHSEEACLRLLLTERCRAIIVTSSSLNRDELAEAAHMVPVVTVARYCDVDRVDSVFCDPGQGERLAVEHLFSLGHRAIAHIGGQQRSMAPEREAGYRRAMVDLGLSNYACVLRCGDDLDAGAVGADRLLAMREPVTAVTCYNDDVAAGLVIRLRQRGLAVPESLSVVGYNDLALATHPAIRLTTVRQSTEELATLAMDLVAQRIEVGTRTQPGEERRISVPSCLVLRESTKAVV